MGVNTALFSIVNSVLSGTLPYSKPEQLVPKDNSMAQASFKASYSASPPDSKFFIAPIPDVHHAMTDFRK